MRTSGIARVLCLEWREGGERMETVCRVFERRDETQGWVLYSSWRRVGYPGLFYYPAHLHLPSPPLSCPSVTRKNLHFLPLPFFHYRGSVRGGVCPPGRYRPDGGEVRLSPSLFASYSLILSYFYPTPCFTPSAVLSVRAQGHMKYRTAQYITTTTATATTATTTTSRSRW
ncbi:hypothetical protein E2C01_040822 [Portunus trituberculatus]|uniref:Uncharacterized protein n=1 Tax=Portunus trituberculatus TaxID=210409 RepID=A0A5B7FP06_PORTR|nr:hypothetical protein [Portunus trituberculatus]